jgi:dTDP-4-dehydrorhamnose reductase
MRILITGGNGLLGQKLVKLISEDKINELLVTGRGPVRFPYRADYQEMDICDAQSVERIFNNYKPEAVINTAAMTNVDQCELNQHECHLMNVEAVKIIIEACAKVGAFLLHLSTDFIFDGSHGPLTEEEDPAPVNYYGHTKLEAEELISSSEIEWALARTVLVYGVVSDMSRTNIILWVRDSLKEGKVIRVVDDQWRTPTLAEDLADGCYRIVSKKAKGIFNISGKDFLTPYQMANYTAEYFGLDKGLIQKTDSTEFKQPARRPLKTGFILDKAQKELGYEPHSFIEGIDIVARQVDSIHKN